MISSALHALRGALQSCRTFESPAAQLTHTMDALDSSLRTCSAGAAELDKAIGRVEKAFAKGDGRKVIEGAFAPDIDLGVFVKRLVRNHITTSRTGLDHALASHSYRHLDGQARGLIRCVRPEVRAEIVRRWTEPEGSSVHVTEGKVVALDIPGTDFRCALIDGGFSSLGLNLSQSEATQLLLARPEGTPPGTTLLQMLPGLGEDHTVGNYFLICAAIGSDGSLSPGLDSDAVYSLAAEAHDFLKDIEGDVSVREPLARFFNWMGDNTRAAQSREIAATLREGMDPRDNLRLGEVARGALTTTDEIRAFNQASVAENRQWAGFHYARAEKPRLAVDQYLKSAKAFEAVRQSDMAATMYANAAEKLASYEVFPEVIDVLHDAIRSYGGAHGSASKVGLRCADAFAARGLHVSAAMTHELLASHLWPERESRNVFASPDTGAAGKRALAETHLQKAREIFAAIGLSETMRDLPGLIRSAIAANLDTLTSQDGLIGNDFVVYFEGASDVISQEGFDEHASLDWVLFRRSPRDDVRQVYELMTEDTRRALVSRGGRHLYRQVPLEASDFVDGVAALDMLTTRQATGALKVVLRFDDDSAPTDL
ncbi:hypothetical protein [Pandoraea sp. ISTKB]|uniref:hypothetical protein n=1 Tax=Pandoraea sp. ISTKB TaxID=1586708 RepID=UPI000846B612|nr:hypothetical protein [Pandoraea sp. ISTKB]ODP32043.1 hypothetical protein A9762_24040 [Pandoraea sp. ISTKB]